MTKRTRILLIVLCFTLALFGVVSYSFMFRSTETKENNFVPGKVVVSIQDGVVYTHDVNNPTDASNTPVFVRVRFVAYYKNGDDIVGVDSPAITCTSNDFGWLSGPNNTWYYPNPRNPGENITIPVVTAASKDGYTLVIEAFAEGIQANPTTAVVEAWGVTVTDGTITGVPNS